jgi:hypothetical protein
MKGGDARQLTPPAGHRQAARPAGRANIPHGANPASGPAWRSGRARSSAARATGLGQSRQQQGLEVERDPRLGCSKGRGACEQAMQPVEAQSDNRLAPQGTASCRQAGHHDTQRQRRLCANPPCRSDGTRPPRRRRRWPRCPIEADPHCANAPSGSSPTGRCAWRKRNQTRLNTSVPLVPPKPKLFLTATSILRSRASLAQ